MKLWLAVVWFAAACGPSHGGDIDAYVPPLPDAVTDLDSDGIPDGVEGCFEVPARDTDMDGAPDCKDTDSDNDGLDDSLEGLDDWDMDGQPNYIDPRNDGPPPTLTLIAISTPFNSPIGIDFHEP